VLVPPVQLSFNKKERKFQGHRGDAEEYQGKRVQKKRGDGKGFATAVTAGGGRLNQIRKLRVVRKVGRGWQKQGGGKRGTDQRVR